MHHVLSYSTGGLLIVYHNEIHENVFHLTRQAFSPNLLCGKHLIHLGRSRSEEEMYYGGSVPETRCYMSIRSLRESQMEVIIDVRFGDADAEIWKTEVMDNILARWEKSGRTITDSTATTKRKKFSVGTLS